MNNISKLPNKCEIFKYLFYCKLTGNLIWKDHWCYKTAQRLKGKIAGRKNKNYYLQIGFKYKRYMVHRIIFFIETGEQPDFIDHIDGNRSNNKFSNLRAVDNRKNQHNTLRQRQGKLVGCTFNKKLQKWKAQIKQNHKVKGLGYFNTELEAHERYIQELKTRGLL